MRLEPDHYPQTQYRTPNRLVKALSPKMKKEGYRTWATSHPIHGNTYAKIYFDEASIWWWLLLRCGPSTAMKALVHGSMYFHEKRVYVFSTVTLG